MQALILEVRDTPSAVKIILSRSHPELIRRLFEREVPEVGEQTDRDQGRWLLSRAIGRSWRFLRSIARWMRWGHALAFAAAESRILSTNSGEKIDIVRWNESSQILISNALKPAEVAEVALCFELGRATVVVNEDQLSLAIGKRGQNVRLAARLTGWDIDILTPPEFQKGVQRLDATLKSVTGVTQDMVDKVVVLGLIDVRDLEEVGAGPLMEELGLTERRRQNRSCSGTRSEEAEAGCGGGRRPRRPPMHRPRRLTSPRLTRLGTGSVSSESSSETAADAADQNPRRPGSRHGRTPEVIVHQESSSQAECK